MDPQPHPHFYLVQGHPGKLSRSVSVRMSGLSVRFTTFKKWKEDNKQVALNELAISSRQGSKPCHCASMVLICIHNTYLQGIYTITHSISICLVMMQTLLLVSGNHQVPPTSCYCSSVEISVFSYVFVPSLPCGLRGSLLTR